MYNIENYKVFFDGDSRRLTVIFIFRGFCCGFGRVVNVGIDFYNMCSPFESKRRGWMILNEIIVK